MRGYVLLAMLLLTGMLNANPLLVAEPKSDTKPSFETEQLVFWLEPGKWRMEGDYGFVNFSSDPIRQAILFPIPSDSLQSMAYDISVTLGSDHKPLQITSVNEQGFWFDLVLPEFSFDTVHIGYSQRLYGNSASYILLSALAWGKPLRYVSYTLHADPILQFESLPFSNPEESVTEGMNTYQWDFFDFVPKTNFDVRWY